MDVFGDFFPVFFLVILFILFYKSICLQWGGGGQNKTEAKHGLFFPDAFMREEPEGWGVDRRGVWYGGRGTGLLLLIVMIFILRRGEI